MFSINRSSISISYVKTTKKHHQLTLENRYHSKKWRLKSRFEELFSYSIQNPAFFTKKQIYRIHLGTCTIFPGCFSAAELKSSSVLRLRPPEGQSEVSPNKKQVTRPFLFGKRKTLLPCFFVKDVSCLFFFSNYQKQMKIFRLVFFYPTTLQAG